MKTALHQRINIFNRIRHAGILCRVGTAHRNAVNIYSEGGQCPPYHCVVLLPFIYGR